MTQGVRKRGKSYEIAYEIGQHLCQRCVDCRRRYWIDSKRLQSSRHAAVGCSKAWSGDKSFVGVSRPGGKPSALASKPWRPRTTGYGYQRLGTR